MSRQVATIIILVLSLGASASAQNTIVVPKPKQMAPVPGPSTPLNLRPAPTEPVVMYMARPENTIFPSLLLCTATMDMTRGQPQLETQLGEPGGFFGIGVQCPTSNLPITLTISCDELMEPSTYKGTLTKANQTYIVMPKIKWKFRELARSRQQIPVNIVFKVKLGDREETEHTETCSVRTINDCPLVFVDEGRALNMYFVFAAYVNEDHPWVDTLLKDALQTGIVTAFTGYQANDPDSVAQQVYAIWRVLQSRGISYSDVACLSVTDKKVFSQSVRFLDECITNKQANCIDGTVMIASVLRKIGINSKIVCVPGHAFLAIDLDDKGNEMIGLETTILGQARKEDFDRLAKLHATLIKQPTFEDASWNSFQAATKVGTEHLAAELPKLTGKVKAEFNYRLISIAEAREMGVRPIPYATLIAPATRTLVPVRR